MEFAEILALIKKVIFLVGGTCVLILLYYRFVKPDRDISRRPMKKAPDEPTKTDEPVIRVRRCMDDYDQRIRDPHDVIDVDENEREWIERETDPFSDIMNEKTPQEKKQELIEELKDLGYTSNTEMNADPFED